MKIYTFQQGSDNWNPVVTFFSTIMYHGEAVLPKNRIGCASHDIREKTPSPMQLICNGYQLPSVFIPIRSTNLIVHEQVMERLSRLSSVFKFLPVDFVKVYRLPWSLSEPVDLEAWAVQYVEQGQELSILANGKHDVSLAATIGNYYEVVTYNHYRLLDNYKPTHHLFTKFYKTPPLSSDLLPVSREMFRDYPITNAGFPVVREDIFALLKDFADLRFFGVTELSL